MEPYKIWMVVGTGCDISNILEVEDEQPLTTS